MCMLTSISVYEIMKIIYIEKQVTCIKNSYFKPYKIGLISALNDPVRVAMH